MTNKIDCTGVWGFPQQAKRTARQGRDGAFFGSVATLPMLAYQGGNVTVSNTVLRG